MLADIADLDRADLSVVDRVVDALVGHGADPASLMLVGAHCRNLWAQALDDPTPLSRTHDLDIGMAVSSMEAWSELTSRLSPMPGASSKIAFKVADLPVDVLPFGRAVESPPGMVTPPTRRDEPFSVLTFEDVFRAGVAVALPSGHRVTVPTPEGLTLLKIAALHDRSQYGEVKDAQDLAVVRGWYLAATLLEERLYDDDLLPLLVETGMRPAPALMRMWGQSAIALVSGDERSALLEQWKRCAGPLRRIWASERRDRAWRHEVEELVDALDRGLRT